MSRGAADNVVAADDHLDRSGRARRPADGSTGGVERKRMLHRRLSHAAAVLWTLVLALALLSPALSRGWSIGPYHLLANQGLTRHTGVAPHGGWFNADLVTALIPWQNLDWVQVHHGILPLWNPYNGQGLPLAFNWQSASFAVPTLIGYLFPLNVAFTASVVATFVIAGTGAYVLGRTLALGFVGSLMIATVFELGGPMVGWLGFPNGSEGAWGGWMLAAALLVVRGRRRLPCIVFLAVILACAVYSGHPETCIVMVGALAVFVITVLALRALPRRSGFPGGPILRPSGDLLLATFAAAGLSAPLLFPALQLTGASTRSSTSASTGLPVHDLLYVIFSNFDGVPVIGSLGFGSAYFYSQTAAYVGIIACVLAAIGLVVGVRTRLAAALGAAAIALVAAGWIFVELLTRLVHVMPLLGEVDPTRALIPLSLALAVLAGYGLDSVARSSGERFVRVSLTAGFAAAVMLLAGLWVFTRSTGLLGFNPTWRAAAIHTRTDSFSWPVVGVAVGVAATALLWWRFRYRRLAAAGLLVCESLFLVSSGSILVSSSPDPSRPTPAISALQHVVGAASVGTGPNLGCDDIAISPESNILYAVHEMNAYDPILPITYFERWQHAAGSAAGSASLNLFCPTIVTAAQARLLGVGYVLDKSGTPGPSGGVLAAVLHVAGAPGHPSGAGGSGSNDEDLYRIPGAGRAVVIPVSSGEGLPAADAPGTPVAIDDRNPARWTLTIAQNHDAVLRLHLTDVPGWHATIDGNPLQLDRGTGWMLQARIPPGRHVIVMTYWPTAFTAGVLVALATVLALGCALVLQAVTRRRRARRTGEDSGRLVEEPPPLTF